MFGKYFKTVYKALNTPPVSLICALNGMCALLSKAIEKLEKFCLQVNKCTKCVLTAS